MRRGARVRTRSARALTRRARAADVSIEAPPSLYPPKRYCDLTGQPARYTDPVTKLRFADAAAFDAARRLPPDAVQRYLALRRAAVVLK